MEPYDDIDKDYKTRLKKMLKPIIDIQILIFSAYYFFSESFPYRLTDFIFIPTLASYLIIFFSLIWAVSVSSYQSIPRTRQDLGKLKDKVSKRKNDYLEQHLVASFTEEVLCRYQFFYLTCILSSWLSLSPLSTVVLFLLVSSFIFSQSHTPKDKSEFLFYFVTSLFLGFIFLTTGLLGAILVHTAYNLSMDLVEDYYYTNPPKF